MRYIAAPLIYFSGYQFDSFCKAFIWHFVLTATICFAEINVLLIQFQRRGTIIWSLVVVPRQVLYIYLGWYLLVKRCYSSCVSVNETLDAYSYRNDFSHTNEVAQVFRSPLRNDRLQRISHTIWYQGYRFLYGVKFDLSRHVRSLSITKNSWN